MQALQKKHTDQVSKGNIQRGIAVHEVWALDAREQIQLADGSYVSWIAITGEGSGAILEAYAMPIKYWSSVDPMLVKQWLQEVFAIWGTPRRLRVDNGLPWGTNASVPSALALWLAGLGVEVVYGRPAQSTDNAVIERTHGVLDQWVEADQQANLDALQDGLDWAVYTQRERYRSPHHLTRAEFYPHLYTNPRTYHAALDQWNWDKKLVVVKR